MMALCHFRHRTQKGKIMNLKTTKTPAPVAKFIEKDVRRIQSAVAKRTDGMISKDGYVTNIQSIVAKRSNP